MRKKAETVGTTNNSQPIPPQSFSQNKAAGFFKNSNNLLYIGIAAGVLVVLVLLLVIIFTLPARFKQKDYSFETPRATYSNLDLRNKGRRWWIVDSPEWCTVSATPSGVYVETTDNYSETPRYGSISICSEGLFGIKSSMISITQVGNIATYATLSEESLKFGYDGGAEVVTVSTDGLWQTESAPAWVTVTRDEDNVRINVKANSGSGPRTGDVVLNCGGIRKTVNINQRGSAATYLTVSSTYLSFDYSASTQYVTVNCDGKWYVSTNLYSYVGTATKSGNKVAVKVKYNSGSPRDDYFIIKSGSKSVRVNIHQR